MYKKIIIIICMFLLFGCSNVNNESIHEIIDNAISDKEEIKVNTFSSGYEYFLPSGFSLKKDSGYVQELVSNGNTYYLNIDVVGYYYESQISVEHELDDYDYYIFGEDNEEGYLRITNSDDDFYVELCYNYAIIEVVVEESELRYAISRGINILRSIKYNQLVIEKYINDNDLETSETVYNIPEPEKKSTKNILEYIDSDDEEEDDEE